MTTRRTGEVEVKWGTHTEGESRPYWGVNDTVTSLSILVAGKFGLVFADGERVLQNPGDFVLWRPGVAHWWQAETATTIITLRWPSCAGDSRNLQEGEVKI